MEINGRGGNEDQKDCKKFFQNSKNENEIWIVKPASDAATAEIKINPSLTVRSVISIRISSSVIIFLQTQTSHPMKLISSTNFRMPLSLLVPIYHSLFSTGSPQTMAPKTKRY